MSGAPSNRAAHTWQAPDGHRSQAQKYDFRDAEAIAKAVQRRTMKFVATKTAELIDLQARPAFS